MGVGDGVLGVEVMIHRQGAKVAKFLRGGEGDRDPEHKAHPPFGLRTVDGLLGSGLRFRGQADEPGRQLFPLQAAQKSGGRTRYAGADRGIAARRDDHVIIKIDGETDVIGRGDTGREPLIPRRRSDDCTCRIHFSLRGQADDRAG